MLVLLSISLYFILLFYYYCKQQLAAAAFRLFRYTTLFGKIIHRRPQHLSSSMFLGTLKSSSQPCVSYVLFILMFAAQCNVHEVEASSSSSTGVQISWKCDDPTQTSAFTVTYTLTNRDQCNAPDGTLNLPQHVHCSGCNRVETDNADVYSYYYVSTATKPYSTYTFSVRPTTTIDTGDTFTATPVTGGSPFTTGEAGECHLQTSQCTIKYK